MSDITFTEELALDIYRKEDAQRIKTCNGWTAGESVSDMNSTMVTTLCCCLNLTIQLSLCSQNHLYLTNII